LQILYARDAGHQELRDTLRGFREGMELDPRTREFAEALVLGVEEHRETIDAAIKARSKNWALSRMPKVDLNVMRLAAFELFYRPDIPKRSALTRRLKSPKIRRQGISLLCERHPGRTGSLPEG